MASLRFKRGSTFLMPVVCTEDDGTARDITDDTITCHIRKSSGDTLVAETTVTKTDAEEGAFECLVVAADTALWALGSHYADIRYVNEDDEVDITETIEFEIVREATRS